MTKQQLRLTLHATGLKNDVAGALKGASGPYAEVKLLVSGSDGQPEERLLGRTEAIKNAPSPKWTTSFLFDYSSGKDAIIEVAVVDKMRKGRDAFIGYSVFKIEDILHSRGSITSTQLQGRQQDGMLYARVCKVPSISAGKLTLRWKRSHSKKDPFFEVRRTYDGDSDQSWTPIYRSERIKSWSGESPEWNPASIDVNALCDGDLNKKIQLAVLDYHKKGEHSVMFTANTTVNELIKSNKGKSFNLMKRSKISLGECNITEADTSAMMKPVKKLQLSLHATDLKHVAGGLKGVSNAYAEVKLLVSGSDKGILLKEQKLSRTLHLQSGRLRLH